MWGPGDYVIHPKEKIRAMSLWNTDKNLKNGEIVTA